MIYTRFPELCVSFAEQSLYSWYKPLLWSPAIIRIDLPVFFAGFGTSDSGVIKCIPQFRTLRLTTATFIETFPIDGIPDDDDDTDFILSRSIALIVDYITDAPTGGESISHTSWHLFKTRHPIFKTRHPRGEIV